MREPLPTAEQVANVLGVTPSWVAEQSRRGPLPTVEVGRRRRREAIDGWLRTLGGGVS